MPSAGALDEQELSTQALASMPLFLLSVTFWLALQWTQLEGDWEVGSGTHPSFLYGSPPAHLQFPRAMSRLSCTRCSGGQVPPNQITCVFKQIDDLFH
jgi:hypothetical protein